MRHLFWLTLVLGISSPALAQQPNAPSAAPTTQQCNAAINAVGNQRNRALNEAADAEAQLSLLASENETQKKQLADAEKAKSDLNAELTDLKSKTSSCPIGTPKP